MLVEQFGSQGSIAPSQQLPRPHRWRRTDIFRHADPTTMQSPRQGRSRLFCSPGVTRQVLKLSSSRFEPQRSWANFPRETECVVDHTFRTFQRGLTTSAHRGDIKQRADAFGLQEACAVAAKATEKKNRYIFVRPIRVLQGRPISAALS